MKATIISAISTIALSLCFGKLAIAYEIEREAQYKSVSAIAAKACNNRRSEQDRANCVIQHFNDIKR